MRETALIEIEQWGGVVQQCKDLKNILLIERKRTGLMNSILMHGTRICAFSVEGIS